MASNTQESVRQALVAVAEAEKRRDERLRQVNADLVAETAAPNKVLQNYLAELKPLAFDIACEERKAPIAPHGRPYAPSSAELTDDGLELCWCLPDGPDWYFTATWEQLRTAQAATA